jgi:NADPH2:quinone reductase
VQLAAGIGARVMAVVGGGEKARFCVGLGAERALDHSACDFAAAAREATGGRGVDVVFDPVQGQMGAQARTALAPEGRAVLCGHAGGIEPIDPRSFYMANLTIVGATMGAYPPAMGRAIEADAQRRILALLESGRFKPVVGRVIDFDKGSQSGRLLKPFTNRIALPAFEGRRSDKAHRFDIEGSGHRKSDPQHPLARPQCLECGDEARDFV